MPSRTSACPRSRSTSWTRRAAATRSRPASCADCRWGGTATRRPCSGVPPPRWWRRGSAATTATSTSARPTRSPRAPPRRTRTRFGPRGLTWPGRASECGHVGLRRLAALPALVLALALAPAADAADQWFKTDTHVHSVVSGDALPDLGIISAAGKARGYNAMFVTDHQAGSNLATSTVIANHISFDDDVLGDKWDPDFFGAPSVHIAELATTPVKTGTKSLHVKATAPSAFGESYVMLKRGPSLRSGDLILKF